MTAEDQHQPDEPVVVTVSVPGSTELKFEFLKVNSIADVKMMLKHHMLTRHHTSYQLMHGGKQVGEDVVLGGLLSNDKQKALAVELKLLPYTATSLREHLIGLRSIAGIKPAEPFGLNSGVSKFTQLELSDPKEEIKGEGDKGEGDEAEKKAEVPVRSFEEKERMKQIIDSFFKDLPQGYYTPDSITTPALRALYYGPYNPVPLNYKSKGHLAYLVLQTFENEIFHITASTTGFFVNKSTNNKFDPSARDTPLEAFTLYDLISKISKGFTCTIENNVKNIQSLDSTITSEAQCTFLSNPWITKAQLPIADFGREQFEDKSTKDFNQECQTFRDLPNVDVRDRIIREKLLAKCTYDFTVQATKTALAILNGAYTPLNSDDPDDPEHTRIYLEDGIFYSFAADVGSFTSSGGDAAARASSNQDLQAIKFINTLDSRGIYTLLTTIVDYAGKRVVCQTPVPGLFTNSQVNEVKNEETGELELQEGETLTKVAYGYDDIVGAVVTDEEFVQSLETIRKALHYKQTSLEKDVTLVTNPQIKGMRGTDQRKYILDLYNATPLDVEFIDNHYNSEDELSFPHKQVVVRAEAVQEWWSAKTKELITQKAEEQGIDLNAQLKEGEQPPTVTIDQDELLFSVDGVNAEGNECSNVRAVSQFITKTLIPRFLEQYEQVGSVVPIDGSALSSQLHKSGINVRYLGYIASLVEKAISKHLAKEEEQSKEIVEHNKEYNTKVHEREEFIMEQLKLKSEAEKKGEKYDIGEFDFNVEELDVPAISASNLSKQMLDILILDMVSRASKHILRSFAKDLPIQLVSSLIAHFHNALLGGSYNPDPKANVEGSALYSDVELEFTKLTPQTVQELIVKDVKIHYRYDLPENFLKRFSMRQLQREIAIKFGIQWNQRDYFFTKEQYEIAESRAQDEKKKSHGSKKNGAAKGVLIPLRADVFDASDVSFAPIIKDAIPRCGTADQFFEGGRYTASEDDADKKQAGFDLIREAIDIYIQVYGELHPEVQKTYATLSHLFQESGLLVQSVLAARKALLISERVSGLDSHDTFVALLNLGYLELVSGSLENSLKVYARLSQLWAENFENRNISIPTFFSYPIFQLQEEGYAKEATILVEKLIRVSSQLHGEKGYTTATLKYRLAFLHAIQEKYNECLNVVSAAYKDLVEVASEKNVITQQAASLQKRIRAWKQVNDLTAKQNKAEAAAGQAAISSAATVSSKANGKKDKGKSLDGASIDELLNFVTGSGSGKKNKKGKK